MIDSTWGWSVKEQVLKLLCDNCVTYSSRLLRKSAGASISMLVDNCYIHYCVVVTTKLRYLEQYLGCRGRPYLWQIAKEYTTPPIWVHRDEFIGLFYYIIQHNAFGKKTYPRFLQTETHGVLFASESHEASGYTLSNRKASPSFRVYDDGS